MNDLSTNGLLLLLGYLAFCAFAMWLGTRK